MMISIIPWQCTKMINVMAYVYTRRCGVGNCGDVPSGLLSVRVMAFFTVYSLGDFACGLDV